LGWLNDVFYELFGITLDAEDVSRSDEIQILAATVMAAAAYADKQHKREEREAILRTLDGWFGLNQSKGLKLLLDATRQLKNHGIERIYDRVRRRLPLDLRERLLVAILRVVDADRARGSAEARFIQRTAARIGVPRRVVDRAWGRYLAERATRAAT
jgi:uncharacterized tellurite resistance protein B-like protein